MVKKIKYIEEEVTPEDMDQADYQTKMLEYMHSMDWKMWEMFQIVQAFAEREGIVIKKDDKDSKPVAPAAEEVPELDADIDAILLEED